MLKKLNKKEILQFVEEQLNSEFVEKFKKNIPAYMLRHKMKAGITGWAQVNGWRGDTSLEKRIECDIYYIKNWSLWLDIRIIFLTFIKGFINKGI
jgi:lipopolysaccharide/colanic/teichoic acid biosynthesis glycosyltransferase